MRVALKKVEGLSGIDVSLKEGEARIAFQTQNRTSYTAIRRAITDNGFNVRETQLVASGTLRSEAGGWRFQVSGTEDSFLVVPDSPSVAEQLKTLAENTVVVRGSLPPPESAPLPRQLRVQSLETEKP